MRVQAHMLARIVVEIRAADIAVNHRVCTLKRSSGFKSAQLASEPARFDGVTEWRKVHDLRCFTRLACVKQWLAKCVREVNDIDGSVHMYVPPCVRLTVSLLEAIGHSTNKYSMGNPAMSLLARSLPVQCTYHAGEAGHALLRAREQHVAWWGSSGDHKSSFRCCSALLRR